MRIDLLVLSLSTCLAMAGAVGCPLRDNPAYHPVDADTGADGDADTDADADVDADVDVDIDPGGDADSACGPTETFCDGECESLLDPTSCGGCGRVCATEGACACSGSPPVCAYHGGRRCYTACSASELLCAEDCVSQPDDSHCGACGVRCDGSPDCECRLDETSGGFTCQRPDGDGWAPC